MIKNFIKIMIIAFLVVLSGCSQDEPKDNTVKNNFLQSRADYENLLAFLKEDYLKLNISFVSSENPERTKCDFGLNKHSCNLEEKRYLKYKEELKKIGLKWVSVDNNGEYFYFVSFYRPSLANARLRGVVYCENKAPKDSASNPKTNYFHIENTWYSFLSIE